MGRKTSNASLLRMLSLFLNIFLILDKNEMIDLDITTTHILIEFYNADFQLLILKPILASIIITLSFSIYSEGLTQ